MFCHYYFFARVKQIWQKLWKWSFNLGTEEIAIERNKLIDTIPSWGPYYRVNFDLHINSFGSGWSSVISFRGNNAAQTCCNMGDRTPIMQLEEAHRRMYFIMSLREGSSQSPIIFDDAHLPIQKFLLSKLVDWSIKF